MRRLFALFLFLFVLTPGLVLAESPARNDGSVDPAAREYILSTIINNYNEKQRSISNDRQWIYWK